MPEKKILIKYNNIVRDKLSKNIINKSLTKEFLFNYDKRIIIQNEEYIIDTVPFGYEIG